MKRSHRYVMVITAVVITLIAVLLCVRYSYGTFSLEDYSSFCIEQKIPSSERRIDSRPEAVSTARELLHDIYGLSPSDTSCCSVAYDSRSDCWLVDAMSQYVWCGRCSPFYGTTGGEYHVILSSSGQPLGIWCEM